MSGRGRPQAPADQKNAQLVDDALARKFDKTVEALSKHQNLEKDTLCTSEACAKLVAQIQIFMDQKLGLKSRAVDRFMTKIPTFLFKDFSEGGSLEFILKTALEFRQQMQAIDGSVLRRFELLSEKQRLYARDLCLRLSEGLKEGGYWKVPLIYFWDDIPSALASKLQEIAIRHEGKIVEDIHLATHIVMNEKARDAEDSEIYTREVAREGNRLLAHWWYYPDSWNVWTSAIATPEQEWTSTDIPPDGKWKLGCDWLLDMESFNEWMCELDYEVFNLPTRMIEILSLGTEPTAVATKAKRGKHPSRKLKDLIVDSPVKEVHPISDEAVVQSDEPALTPVPEGEATYTPDGRQVDNATAETEASAETPFLFGARSGPSAATPPEQNVPESHVGAPVRWEMPSAPSAAKKRPFIEETTPAKAVIDASPSVDLESEVMNTKRIRSTAEASQVQSEHSGGDATGEAVEEKEEDVTDAEEDLATLVATAVKPKPPIAAVGAVPLAGGGISVAALADTHSVAAVNGKQNPVVGANDEGAVLDGNTEGESEEKREDSAFLQASTLEKEEDASSMVSAGAATYSVDVNKKAASTPNHSIGPQEIAPDVVKHAPHENLLYSSALLSKDRAALISLGSGDQKTVISFQNALQPIPLGALPDRPPPHGIEEMSMAVSPDEKEITARAEASATSAENPITLPTCSQWFDLNFVHRIEKDQLAALFTGTNLSPAEKEASYRHIRNTIVLTYRRNPEQYLSVTECRKIIDGDAALILRLHSFLDYWGIINFQAHPSTIMGATLKGKDFVLSDTMLYSNMANEMNNVSNKPAAVNGSYGSTSMNGGANNFQFATKPPYQGGGPWKCAACGKLCLYSYYVIRPGNTTGVSLGVLDKCVWCLKCFADGRYPSVLTEKHFLKVDIPILDSAAIDPSWTPTELTKLIEGIELYKENWDAVAKHVGTGKTPHQCVSFFISIPIEEPFLDSSKKSSADAVPFVDMANPLLAQLAFLASVVSPTVAASAAKAAFDSLVDAGTKPRDATEEMSTVDNATGASNFEKSGENQASSDNTDDAMQQKEVGLPRADNIANGVPAGFVTDLDMKVACSAAVAAAATRARELADIEEEEIHKILPKMIDLQLQKLEVKRQRFKLLEDNIQKDKNALEEKFNGLMAEWLELKNGLEGGVAKNHGNALCMNNTDGVMIRDGSSFTSVNL